MLYVDPQVAHQVLISKLQTDEKVEMAEQQGFGVIRDVATFADVFLRRFGDRTTGVQKLRLLMTRRMTAAAVNNKDYQTYGHELTRLAHNAYRQLGLPKAIYEEMDKVIVVNAFIYGVTQKLSEYLLQQNPETLVQCVKHALVWANSQGGLHRYAQTHLLAVTAASGQEESPGEETEERVPGPCQSCSAEGKVPWKCRHCYRCGDKGHQARWCPREVE